jgi:hypothetical protein
MVGETILYAPSEADDPAFRAAISAFTGGTVDYFDASTGTPDVTLLQSYDCVYTWANYAFLDPTSFGNNLADAVDAGTVVILGAFCTYTSGNSLGGEIMTSAYSPVFSPSGSNHFGSSNYAGDGTTPIHNGVTTYECTFRDFCPAGDGAPGRQLPGRRDRPRLPAGLQGDLQQRHRGVPACLHRAVGAAGCQRLPGRGSGRATEHFDRVAQPAPRVPPRSAPSRSSS